MRLFLIALMTLTTYLCSHMVDIVVFSYNRPLQLYAFLESLTQYGQHVGQVSVLYRSSDDQYELGYQIVKEAFPQVLAFRQRQKQSQSDFKPLLMQILDRHCPNGYIAFAVDDLICKDDIDFSFCVDWLEKEKAEAFHLRMGENLNYCYTMDCAQPLPPMHRVTEGVNRWIFSQGKADWNYPHTVDMAIFRKDEVVRDFKRLPFTNPNTLEGNWTSTANYQKRGLCFTTSKVVNFPLNLVNQVYANRHMTEYPPEMLLKLFLEGYKMDLIPLHQILNRSAHMEYAPTFKEREL